jgi:hypothetical protein
MSSVYDHTKRNAVGFGGGTDKMITFDIADFKTTGVKGVVCSDNYDHEKVRERYVFLKCTDIARGNQAFAHGINTNIRVHCPPECIKVLENRYKLWGSGPYKDDS